MVMVVVAVNRSKIKSTVGTGLSLWFMYFLFAGTPPTPIHTNEPM
jgi:hypothetical protein